MNNKIELSPTHILAAALWSVAVKIAVIMLIVESPDTASRLGNLAVFMAAGAATVTVRGYFIRWDRHMRNAFELGRDSAIDSELRSIS